MTTAALISSEANDWTHKSAMIVAPCVALNMIDGMDFLVVSFLAPTLQKQWGRTPLRSYRLQRESRWHGAGRTWSLAACRQRRTAQVDRYRHIDDCNFDVGQWQMKCTTSLIGIKRIAC